MTSELKHSRTARSVLSKFYDDRIVVYVEGQDDEPFWEKIFSFFGITNTKFKITSGVNELKKIEKEILDDDLGVIVARDCDYTDLLDQQSDHPRVIYTYGYSIENTLYLVRSIVEIINMFSIEKIDEVEVELWLTEFSDAFTELLYCDLANEIYGFGQVSLGKNSQVFLKSRGKSFTPCADKIQCRLEKLSAHLTEESLLHAQEIIEDSPKSVADILRGHFLKNAVQNFIAKKSRKKSVSDDELYSNMILQLTTNLHSNSEHYKYFETQFGALKLHYKL